MGASEGLQSLCGHILDSILPLFSLQLRVHRDQCEVEYGRTIHFCFGALLASVQIIIVSMFSPCHIFIPLSMLCRI